MLRRLCTVLLMLACVLAPVLPAHAWAGDDATAACCCGSDCAAKCGQTDCAPPPANNAPRAPATDTTAVAPRAPATQPAARAAVLAFARFIALSLPGNFSIAPSSVRAASSARGVPAASVAVFHAHCSLLL